MRTSIQRNLVWLTASQIATWMASLVVIVVLPRHLSPEDFGSLQFAIAFVGYFMLVGSLGTNTYLVKTIARDESAAGQLIVNTLVMKVALTIALSAMALTLGWVLGYPGRTMLLIIVACTAMVLNVLNEAVGATLQGLQRINKFALWRVVQTYIGAAIGLAVLFGNKGVVAYAIVAPLVSLIPLVANTAHIWPEMRRSLHIDYKVWGTIVRGGAPFLLWSAILVIYGTIDIPLLKVFAGEATVGAYALAYAWIAMPAGFSSVVVTATMPSLSANAMDESSNEFSRLANRSIALVAFVGIPASIGIILVASDVFTLLNYQQGFEQAVPLVQILALHIPIVGIDMVLGSALIAADKQKIWTLIACCAAVMNPLINVFAIPLTVNAFGNGGIGAATVTVATELLMMTGAILVRPKGVMDKGTAWFAVRCVLASLVMVPAVFAVSSAGLPIKIAAGIGAYALASLVFGTMSRTVFRRGLRGLSPSELLNAPEPRLRTDSSVVPPIDSLPATTPDEDLVAVGAQAGHPPAPSKESVPS